MSTNQRRGVAGRKVKVTAPTGGYASGALVTLKAGVSGWVGENKNVVSAGETAVVEVGHEIEVTKNTGTGESFSIGDDVYKDASTGKATATATGNDYAGRATSAATTVETTVWVMLAPTGK